jgi:hypothetical protein
MLLWCSVYGSTALTSRTGRMFLLSTPDLIQTFPNYFDGFLVLSYSKPATQRATTPAARKMNHIYTQFLHL